MLKKQTLLLLAIVSAFLMSCMATNGNDSKLYGNQWELEYITGPRITFEGLFPDMKPVVSFDKSSKMVRGNSGCNGYAAKYTMNEMKINFAQPEISTMMYCGDGEVVFLKTMQEVDSYKIDADGKLVLMMGDVPMMRFHEKM